MYINMSGDSCDTLTKKFIDVTNKHLKELDEYKIKKDTYTRWSKKEGEFKKYEFAGKNEDIKVYQMKELANDSEKNQACSMCSEGKSIGNFNHDFLFTNYKAYCNPGKNVELSAGKYKNIGNKKGTDWDNNGNASIWFKCGKDQDTKQIEEREYINANPYGPNGSPPNEPKLNLPPLNLVCCNQVLSGLKGKIKIDKLVQDCDQQITNTKRDKSNESDDYETKETNQQYVYVVIALIVVFLCCSLSVIGYFLMSGSDNTSPNLNYPDVGYPMY